MRYRRDWRMLDRTGFILCCIFGVGIILLVHKHTPDNFPHVYAAVKSLPQWNTQLTNESRNYLLWKNETPNNETMHSPASNCSEFALLKSRRISVNLTLPSWGSLFLLTKHLLPGGKFKPHNCTDPDRVAIIVPYRNRPDQLKVFLRHMHPFLQRQHIQYGVYIIEQTPGLSFNRGTLMNIGFAEAAKRQNYQCFVFHDVDLLPEDDANMYTCPRQPRHMSTSIDKFDYRLRRFQTMGGVIAMTKQHFEKVNGFSNVYFGWGSEDDDLYRRTVHVGLDLIRYPQDIARYTMIKHKHEIPNPQRKKIIASAIERMLTDGINSLKYKVINTTENTLYSRILVNINAPAKLKLP